MNSIIRAASRLAIRPPLDRVYVKNVVNINSYYINKRFSHNQPLTYDWVRERILLTCKLFDKIDPEKITLDSHFVNDLGLDSLDHVEIIMHLEDEFSFEIPDKDMEKLITPRHILQYITDKEEAYEALQHHDHDHDSHDHEIHDDPKRQEHPLKARYTGHDKYLNPSQKNKGFFSWFYLPKRSMSSKIDGGDPKYPTSFETRKFQPIDIKEIQDRVMKVCSKYDKIDSSKLDLVSHFVQDLGLDSLDHVEIMMELEDEFSLEIPDKDAEKLMRPIEVAKYIFQREEKRVIQPEDRPV